jgi:formylglycine-generating enzyme required for sulfatase activity
LTATNDLGPNDACAQKGASGRPCKVGSFPPNRLGFFDMHGNVAEWCFDMIAPANGDHPELSARGGSWKHLRRECRATSETGHHPLDEDYTLGARAARVYVGK